MKLWSFTELSEADSGEDSQYFFLQPLEQLHLGVGVWVRDLLWQAQGRWLISDEAGSLIQARRGACHCCCLCKTRYTLEVMCGSGNTLLQVHVCA